MPSSAIRTRKIVAGRRRVALTVAYRGPVSDTTTRGSPQPAARVLSGTDINVTLGHIKSDPQDSELTPGVGGESRVYRMTARQEAVDRTRERLLRAAYDLFLEQPYDRVTLEAVAGAAGVTRQTLLRHFGSKAELVVAAADWMRPREDASRQVEPGDVRSAIGRLIGRYETIGDANVRFLELEGRIDAVHYALEHGREGHRAWIENVFAPDLARVRGRERERVVLALYAATDVMVWKLLRRDFGLSRSETEAIVRRLVEGVLGTVATPTNRRAT
jgi:AcrR family transcriptional regulator